MLPRAELLAGQIARFSSWPGIAVRRTASLPLAYARPSTSFLLPQPKDVDARDKPGHDEFRADLCPPGKSPNRLSSPFRKNIPVHF
jgi:hypothetical protein